jgi:hypothetical protein
MSPILLFKTAKTINVTNILVEKHKRHGNCGEECSRLHSEKLMLKFFWVWDYICYTIKGLERT